MSAGGLLSAERGIDMDKLVIPEIKPLFIGFASATAALMHRSNAGGWVYVPNDNAGAVWFDPQFTASAVLSHHAAKGSGKLF